MFPRQSVKKPFTVVVAVIIVIILGVVSFTKMTTDLLPNIELPYVIVMTTYPGASPETVEKDVTRPVEQAMATLSSIKEVSSSSAENYSLVIMEFEDTVNMDSITIDIRESLDSISASWDDMIGSPIIMKINIDSMPVIISAVDVEGMDINEISDYATETLIPKLEGIEGVASVSSSGIIEEGINVVIREDKVEKLNKKLKDAISEQLDSAEQEMLDAKSELEEGKAQLNEAMEAFNDGIFEGEQQLLAARLELLKGELELEMGESEIASNETTIAETEAQIDQYQGYLDEIYRLIEQQENNLVSQENRLDAEQSDAENEILKIDAEIEKSEQQIAAINSDIENIKNILEDTENIPENADELRSQLSTLTDDVTTLMEEQTTLAVRRAELEASLAVIDTEREGLETIRSLIERLNLQIEPVQAELSDGKSQLEAGKAALSEAKLQLGDGYSAIDDGKTQISDGEKELNATKTEQGAELESGLAELENGEALLNEQLDNFDQTREQALTAADIDDTITVDVISQLLQAQNFSMPAGYITEEGTSYLIKVGDTLADADELENLVIFDFGVDGIEPVKLSDVADVFKTDNSAETYASVDGKSAVIFSMQKQTGYSTAEVSDSIKEKFESLSTEDERISFTTLMDQGIYIDMVVSSVLDNLVQGGILAIVILFIFLKDTRSTFIIACSIPISVIFAIVLMYFSNITLNIISLSGLAVGVGMLVDNSVVVIENIYRLRNKGYTPVQAAVSGASQVGGAITASTLTTVCVFLPIVFVEGLTKQLFVDMALTIAYSLGASLIVALTLVPMMSANMMKNTKNHSHRFMDKFCEVYSKVLRKAVKFKPVTLLLAVVILAASALGAYSKGTTFMSDMDSTQIEVNLDMGDDAEYESTVETAADAMELINQIDGVDTVGAMLGGDSSLSLMGMSTGSDVTQVVLYVILDEDKPDTSQEIAKQIEEVCAELPCEISANGSLIDMSALGGSGVTINIKGQELDKLSEIAEDVAEKLSAVEGIAEVDDGLGEPTPEFKIIVDKEKAVENGLTIAQVYMQISGCLSTSSDATQITENNKDYTITVSDGEEKQLSRDDIRNLEFTTTDIQGETISVKLADIADFEDTYTMSSISRSSQVRYVSVSASLADGYNIGLVSNDVEDVFEDYELPEGYELVFEGENEIINEALEQLVLMLILAVAFIYLIMVAQFQSLLLPFIVMFTIPLAFTGGFIGLIITDNELSVIAMIGFIMLSGIVVNNGIVLVDYINQLRLEGMSRAEAIVEAGCTRMRPILMTALTTILGLSTMALGIGMGTDMVQPIAIVTIGGLLYATFTTLFIIPCLYDIMAKKEPKKIENKELELIND